MDHPIQVGVGDELEVLETICQVPYVSELHYE